MVQQRSRSQRRVKVTTPAGRRVIHYVKRPSSQSSCAHCNKRLHGVSQGRIAASKRNPSRPYAGILCSSCTRNKIKSSI